MKIPTPVLISALNVSLPPLMALLIPSAISRKIAQLEAQYENHAALLAKTGGNDVLKNIAPVQLDLKLIERDEKNMFELVVGPHLRGAIAHYQADNQLECLRHVLLALVYICDILELRDASQYLNDKVIEL